MKMENFKENLFIMERTVVQNLYHSKQATYRGLPELQLFPRMEEALMEQGDPMGKNFMPPFKLPHFSTFPDFEVACVWGPITDQLGLYQYCIFLKYSSLPNRLPHKNHPS